LINENLSVPFEMSGFWAPATVERVSRITRETSVAASRAREYAA